MCWPLPYFLDIPANHRLARILASRRLDAHSDLAEYVAAAERAIPRRRGVRLFAPSPREYSYELRYAENYVVFLVLHGQRGVALRLPWGLDMRAQACASGAVHDPEIGERWFLFDWPDEDKLARWYQVALGYARDSAPSTALAGSDLNGALGAYSHAMGNRKAALAQWAGQHRLRDQIGPITEYIGDIQNGLIDLAERAAGDKGIPRDSVFGIIDEYSEKYLAWIDDAGKAALARWLHWMCWHEGLLDRDPSAGRERFDDAATALSNVVGEKESPDSAEILRALDWLIDTDSSEGAFVTVECLSGAIVQFAGSSEQPLAMDLPLAPLSRAQRQRLTRLMTEVGASAESGAQSYVMRFGTDTRRCAWAAKRIIEDVFEDDLLRCTISRSGD